MIICNYNYKGDKMKDYSNSQFFGSPFHGVTTALNTIFGNKIFIRMLVDIDLS